MKKKPKIIDTEDGSHTIYVDHLKEYYHSCHGAIQESQHVFISNGLKLIRNETISLLEVGFGTGLNALLTFIEAERSHQVIEYDAVELYPLDEQILKDLNYSQMLDETYASLFMKLHQAPWNQTIEIRSFFSLRKMQQDFNVFQPNRKYNLVYFDAFSPGKQPDMWSKSNFHKLYQAMEKEGVLVTYCAKGEIKRRLKSIGFTVELLPGPPGKREIIRATKY